MRNETHSSSGDEERGDERRLDSGWQGVIDALPFPAAVLDDAYRFVLLNRASAADPLLARGRVGATELDGCEGTPALAERARWRRRQYARSRRAQQPRAFREPPRLVPAGSAAGGGAAGGGRRALWVCLPLRAQDRDLLLVGAVGRVWPAAQRHANGQREDAPAEDAPVEDAPADERRTLEAVERSLRVPLTALVGQADALARELPDEQQARAALIDESAQQILRQLRRLLVTPPEPSPAHRPGAADGPPEGGGAD